jgi:hypothetical protein
MHCGGNEDSEQIRIIPAKISFIKRCVYVAAYSINFNFVLAFTIKYENNIEIIIVIKVNIVGSNSVCFWKMLSINTWMKYIAEEYKAILLLDPEIFDFMNNIKTKGQTKRRDKKLSKPPRL